MAGISEIYTTKAMLDSQMMHIGKQGKWTGSVQFTAKLELNSLNSKCNGEIW